ncbi:hypothetical protein DL93DRAFT_488649 [Clavulina sp. PMI_390]|nr:hypothetical protein DL93DRAFT_488649 [Clavulina sp. PMI_390]
MVVLLFWDHEGARKRMSEDPSISHEDCIRLQGPPKLAPENDSISAPPDTPITVTESDVSPDLTGSTVATAPNTPADSIISAPPTVGAAISTPATPTMPVSPRPAPLSTVTVATTTAASVAPAQLVAATAPDAQTTTSSPTRTVFPLSQTLIAPRATRQRIDMPTADLSTTMMQLKRSQANYDRLIKADRELHERTRASLAQYDAFTAKQQNPIIKKLLPLPRPSSLSSSVPSIVKDTKTAAPLPRLSASVPASRSTFISRVTGRPNRYLERFGPAPVGDTQRTASSEASPAPSTPTLPAKQPSSAATSSVSSGQPSVPDANTDTISRAHSSVTDSISPTKTTPRLDRMFDGTLEEPKGDSQLIIPPSVTGDFHPREFASAFSYLRLRLNTFRLDRASTPIADIASSASAPATSSAKIASCLTPSTRKPAFISSSVVPRLTNGYSQLRLL